MRDKGRLLVLQANKLFSGLDNVCGLSNLSGRLGRDWLATLQLPTGLAIDVMMIVIAIVMAGGECQEASQSQTDAGKMWAVRSNSPIGRVVNKRVQ